MLCPACRNSGGGERKAKTIEFRLMFFCLS